MTQELHKFNKYERKHQSSLFKTSKQLNSRNVKFLLPLKCKDGLITLCTIKNLNSTNKNENHSDIKVQNDLYTQNGMESVVSKPLATIQLLASRDEKLKSYRYKIGIISTEILEDPDKKLCNVSVLLQFMNERSPESFVTVRKLAAASLLEIFKDVIPSYSIRITKKNEVKLKKETLQLQRLENCVFKYYKQYLQKLEQMSLVLKKETHMLHFRKQDIVLGIFALNCLCELLMTHSHFNFSSNIANFLVPFLNNKFRKARELVANCFVQVFENDKRGEISLIILRRLNHYIKKHHSMHLQATSILLSLQIKTVNHNEGQEVKQGLKKVYSQQKSILSGIAKEKNRRLNKIKKEMLETKTNDNNYSREKIYTELINLLFSIYFRVLKEVSNNKILSSCLKGLIKYSRWININFYKDILNILNNLLQENNLPLKEQFLCINATFVIISDQTSVFKNDPIRFHSYLYKNILELHLGKTKAEINIIIKTLVDVLIYRSKCLTKNRLIAFIKRICIMALNLQHNTVLSMIQIISLITKNCVSWDILLDTICNAQNSTYLPELDDPEFCNACCTNLWEIIPLQRHYHLAVQSFAKDKILKMPFQKDGYFPSKISKLSPQDLQTFYDPSQGLFRPKKYIKKNESIKNHQNSKTMCVVYENFLLTKYHQYNRSENLFESKFFDMFKECKKLKI